MKLGDNTPFTALQYIISSVTMIRAEHSFFITNISKNLVLDVLAKAWQSYSHKKVTFWGKSTANFAVYLLILEDQFFFHFAKKLAIHNSMQKKDNKVGNKTAYKEERQNESERERKIEIDSKTKWLVRMHEKSDRISRKIQLTLDN